MHLEIEDWKGFKEMYHNIEKQQSNGVNLFLHKCFTDLLYIKIDEIIDEKIKEVVIPDIGSISFLDGIRVKVNKSIFQEPLYGPLVLLNYISLDYIDKDNKRHISVSKENYENVCKNNILTASKVFFFVNEISNLMTCSEVITSEGIVKKNIETNQISIELKNNFNIIKSYEVIYEELGGTIDYSCSEFLTLERKIKGYITVSYPEDVQKNNII